MSARSAVPPETIGVSLDPEGVEVTYADGRSAFYHGVPEKRVDSVVAGPGKEVHVLVTDQPGTEGVLVYVNDRRTHDDVLESSGVGRVLLEAGETTSLFPGVEATNRGLRVEVQADAGTVEGRVFVFVEDELSEHAYELVAGDGPGAGSGDADSTEGA